MLPRTSPRRAGISLIELLVVISIITVLVSLTAAAVQRVRVLGPQTDNYSRMNQIGDAVGRLKNDLRMDYVPSHPINTTLAPGAAGAPVGFALKRSYGSTDPELEFLLRAFPNMDLSDNGYTGQPVVLDANQTLCFFLCGVGDAGGAAQTGFGFSNNPRRPLSPANPGEQRKGPWLEPNSKLFGAGTGFPHLIDPYGTPYAYFASVGGKTNNYGTQSFQGAVSPYQSGGKFVNEKGFQIISAGRDKVFGPGGGNLPATGDPGGYDDHAHFSRGLLGAGLN